MSPNAVTPIMPENTAVPSARRSSAPAPIATTSGNTPSTKASDVMMIGRSRGGEAVAPLVLELLGEFDDQDRVLRRQRDQHDEAHLRENVVVLPAQHHAD